MKRLRVVIGFYALLAGSAAMPLAAQCKPILRALSTTNISISCPGVDAASAGDEVSITVGDEEIAATVVKFVTDPLLGTMMQLSSVDTDPEKLTLINNERTVEVTANEKTFVAAVQNPTPNYFRYEWSIGPATAGETADDAAGNEAAGDVASDGASASGALRLQYSGELARTRGVATSPFGRPETVASLQIDTTDQSDARFTDNNRASVAARWNVPPAGNLFKQGKVGVQARVSKSFHRDVHDVDAAVTVRGWIPAIRTLNLFHRDGDFISAPLAFEASYGYRNRHQAGESFDGRVFEAMVLYHVFAADRYKVDIRATWTNNDLSNRPASVPRTQRLYKASISYLADPTRGFSVLTTIEDGSAGVMLTKVRQYFVGMAMSKLNFTGSEAGR